MEEGKLIERLKLIQALHARATSQGEKEAAQTALERVKERLEASKRTDDLIEFQFSMRSRWNKQLFLAVLARYDIKGYRYKRQRHTTVMARVSESFLNSVLWPEYTALSDELEMYFADVTDRVIEQALGQKKVSVVVKSEPAQLPL